jgi:predicted MFS family arabinose efflux permease
MSDIIFSISFYPLLTFITKTEESFKKKTLIEYFARDIGIVACGLLIGVYIGKYLFSYETCLIISLFVSIIAILILFRFKSNEKHKHNVTESFKVLFKKKINRVFLYNQIIIKISYGVVFSLLMLILVNYIEFDVSVASVYIIVCNVIGSFLALIFTKIGKNYTTTKSALVKFGSRILFYLLAFIFHNKIFFIVAITIGNVTSRMLEEKITAPFLKDVRSDDQFLFSNFRYLSLCLGEGIGAYLAGLLIVHSLKYLFLGGIVFTIIQIFMYYYLDRLKKSSKLA